MVVTLLDLTEIKKAGFDTVGKERLAWSPQQREKYSFKVMQICSWLLYFLGIWMMYFPVLLVFVAINKPRRSNIFQGL